MDSITKEKNTTNVNTVSKHQPFENYYSEKQDVTTVRFEMPITQRFRGKLAAAEIYRVLMNKCSNDLAVIADQIDEVSGQVLMNEYDNERFVQETAAFFSILSQFVKGYTEVFDALETLAKQISEILHNPNLPSKIYNALGDEITEFESDVHSPENVLHNLKKLQKAS